ncbi:MAG: DUF3822 family protein [Cytophagales bacterium]|nr:DUF3822 family protein [Cytophagales bacterium]
MEKVASRYKLYKRCKDANFNVDELEHYALSLQIGYRDFQLAVTDSRNGRVLLLEDFLLREVQQTEEKTDILREIFDNHHLLKAGFWNSATLALKSNKFSLVPSELF